MASLPAQAQDAAASVEYKIKAVFLFNFTKFVDWPEQVFANASAPFTIGIIGEDPFGTYLDLAVANETVKGRKLIIKHLDGNDSPQGCQVLFISRSMKDQVDTILQKTSSDAVLTVSEIDGFAQLGGMINFVVVKRNVCFEVNPGRAQRAGLTISSKLLRLPKAIKVEDSAKVR